MKTFTWKNAGTPEQVIPSGHSNAAVLKTKPPRRLYKLLIDRHLYPHRNIRERILELYVPEMVIWLRIKTLFPENAKKLRR